MINNARVLSSSFIKSIYNKSQAPSPLYTEIAILGRSNVGKSSLINSLLGRKNLAKSSSTPGKTRLINFFISSWEFNDACYDLRFIDFPGFGYAKVSKEQRNIWDRNISDFLQSRDSIKLFIHLIDSRHTNLKIDVDIRDFLDSISRADSKIISVFTKIDKLNSNDLHRLKKLNNPCVSCKQSSSIDFLRYTILNYLYGI